MMIKRKVCYLLLLSSLLAGGTPADAQHSPVTGAYVKPLYTPLPLGAVKPQGWLRHQLQIMRNGTTGHLDEVYGKVKNDNGWLGGKGDGWEETPYWLDGAVPLAYLLDDKELKDKVLRYINWTLDHQRPSGYFGPLTKVEREGNKTIGLSNAADGDDWWPKMVMLKVLQQYYTATDDTRVLPFMTKYFHYQLQALKGCQLGKWTDWAAARGTENMMVAQWLYGITKDPQLLQLSALLQSQAFTWSEWMGNRTWVINAAAQQNDEQWQTRHGVNVAMGLKDPVVKYQRTGDKQYLQQLQVGFADLMHLHGLPMGIFSADEDLHGNSPVQGTELCAVVEAMYSLEEIIGITGDPQYMDALERMTFNALPTQTTDDYNAKQYFQVANQVNIKRGVFNFSLPFDREMNNVLGMRSGYTCCLANMHQGWTKFASHLWYSTAGNGLAALTYSPNEVTAKVGKNNTPVTITEKTVYPFEEQVQFVLQTAQAVSFPLQLHIPAWCNEAVVLLNGEKLRTEKGGQVITIQRTWNNNDQLTLQLPMPLKTSNWGRNSRAVEKGPVVYALKLSEQWEKGHDEAEGDYFSVFPKDPWNYALVERIVQDPAKHLKVKTLRPVGDDFVWNLEHVPIAITATGKKIPEWKITDDVAQQPVTDRNGVYKGKVDNREEEITLVPYGCTKVRIVAFPVVK